MYKRNALHSVWIYVEYIRFNYVDAARGWHDSRYTHMPCTFIRHSFVRFYSFTLHIIQLQLVVVQLYVRYVSRMLHCTLYSSGYNSLRIGTFLFGCWFFKNHANYFFSVEMIIKILLYNSEFLIKRKSFSVSLISSKKLDYIFSKHNVSTCML